MTQEYWDNLATEVEKKRQQKQKEQQEYYKTMQGQIETAFTHFCIWCRCKGYDPYTDTYIKLGEYLKGEDDELKDEDRKLFLPETENYIQNKKALKKLIIEKTKKE